MGRVKHAALAQFGAQRQQHVEHHADAGDGLALERAAGLVRVDDHVGVGQADLLVEQRGQVVVGHQHLQAQRPGARHAVDAGNAVVHGDQHIGAGRLHPLGNRRGQAVAVNDAVRHQIADAVGAQQFEPAQRHGAGGGAVAVVISDHADFFAVGHGIGQQDGRFARALERGRRQQPRQPIVEFVGSVDAARGIQLRQQGVDAGLLQRPDAARRHVAYLYFHGVVPEELMVTMIFIAA